jgi:hypothetical protein
MISKFVDVGYSSKVCKQVRFSLYVQTVALTLSTKGLPTRPILPGPIAAEYFRR